MRRSKFVAVLSAAIALSAANSLTDPRDVFARHDPQGRLPNTVVRNLGIVRVRAVTYSIYYLDFTNPASGHGTQRIAIIKNGRQFAGSYICTIGTGPDEARLAIAKNRLAVKINRMTFVIRFDETGPTRNKYFCGEASGWENSI